MCLTSNASISSNNNSSSKILPSPVPKVSESLERKEEENHDDDDECSIGVDDLADAKEGVSILTGSQRTISPLSGCGDDPDRSVNIQDGSSLSKLDLLRARNREVRRRGSLKIAELRKSLNASSGELVLSPSKKKKNVVGGDDATAATVSSRTWTEPPTPNSTKKVVTLDIRPPLEVEVKDNESIRSARTFETSMSISNFKERYKRLKHENELLRRQLTRLVEHHNDILRKERKNLRLELQSRAKASRNRLRMAAVLFILGVVGHVIANYGMERNANKMSLFSDDIEELVPVPFIDDLVEDGKDRMLIGASGDNAFSAEEMVSLSLESRIEDDSPLGLLIDTTMLDSRDGNNTGDVFASDKEDESMLLEGTMSPETKQAARRPGFLKRVLFNFRNNQMGIWLKHVKM